METKTAEERHSSQVFTYVNWTSGAILVIVIAVFFLPIPAGHDKFVDISLGILLGILSSNSGTVTGNSPATKKGDVNVTGDSPTVPVNNAPANPNPEAL